MVDLAVRSAYLWRSEQREDDATDCPVWGTGWRRCAGLQHTLTGVLRTGRALTATGGASDPKGWPAIKNLAYGELARPAVASDGRRVILGTERATGHDATAVVSLLRRGDDDVPLADVEPGDHLEVRLLGRQPQLDFTLADTAAVIR